MDSNMLNISGDDLWSSIYKTETNNNQLPFSDSSSSTNPTTGIQLSPFENAFGQFFQQAAALDSTTPTLSNNVVINNNNDNQTLALSSILLPNNNNNDMEKCGTGSGIGQLAGWVPHGTNVVLGMHPVEYHDGLLKAQLELACQAAANAMTWESNFNTQDYAFVALDNRSRASTISIPESQVTYAASSLSFPKQQDKDARGSVWFFPKPTMSKHIGSQFSRSFGNLSGDDYAMGEIAMADVRRRRRILSNRESARRSRKKKKALLTELEEQVNQLRVENSSLLKRYNDINLKYNQAVDNYISLTADVRTMGAKVQMADELFKRVEWLCRTVPVQHNHGLLNVPVQGPSTDTLRMENVQPISSADVESSEATMQRVASLEHLQKQTRECTGSSGTDGAGEL